jgi:hypothetical protein
MDAPPFIIVYYLYKKKKKDFTLFRLFFWFPCLVNEIK